MSAYTHHAEEGGRPGAREASALSTAELRALCLEAGADDAGFVPISEPTLAGERRRIEAAFPGARTLVAVCLRMQTENVRSPERSIANQAFHASGHETDAVCRRIVLRMQEIGVRACNPSIAFPMEIDKIGDDRPWLVSHKLVAVAGGLGRMGIHRSVIHPRFGSFILLGTVLLDRPVDAYSAPVDFNPCVSCKLCVAACPVGAIASDGHFNAAVCSTHNYREFLGGFSDWAETVAGARSPLDYREKVPDGETLSVWQSLAFGPNYKAAYCLAVCPAGDDVIGPYVADKAAHLESIVRPLQRKEEPLYIVRGSDADAYAQSRYPRKPRRYVHSGMRPVTIRGFLAALPWLFQREQSAGLSCVYHFVFTGADPKEATVRIHGKTIDVAPGLSGEPDVRIVADGAAWLRFLRRERPLWKLILTRQLALTPWARGARLLAAFGRCYPS
jgi:ferredoxin